MIRKIKYVLVFALAALLLTTAFALLSARRTPAQSGELHVMVSDGMKPVVEDLTPQIEKATGRKLVAHFDSSRNLRDAMKSGEAFDAAIITSDVLDDFIKQGKIDTATRTELARTGIGVGVRAGAPKPDIGTAAALKTTLLNAKGISFNPSGASSTHTYAMFERLGIADAMKPKLMLDSEAGRPQKNVAAGKVELVISLIPEIQFFPGVDLVGPIPAEFQSYVGFAGGVATKTSEADAAKAMLKVLKSPAAAPVIKSKGMEPR